MWHANYPTGIRARITGKFAIVQVTLIAVLSFGLGKAMDFDARAFRVMFPVGAGLGLLAWAIWGGVRVRGQAALIRAETDGDGKDMPSFNPASLVFVLVNDREYGKYMLCQKLTFIMQRTKSLFFIICIFPN